MIRLALLALLLTGCAMTRGQQHAAHAHCIKKGEHTRYVQDHIIWVTWFAYCEGKKAE